MQREIPGNRAPGSRAIAVTPGDLEASGQPYRQEVSIGANDVDRESSVHPATSTQRRPYRHLRSAVPRSVREFQGVCRRRTESNGKSLTCEKNRTGSRYAPREQTLSLSNPRNFQPTSHCGASPTLSGHRRVRGLVQHPVTEYRRRRRSTSRTRNRYYARNQPIRRLHPKYWSPTKPGTVSQ